jgi:hypothetical protein
VICLKRLKRLAAMLLLVFLISSVCGCSTEAQQLEAKNKLILSVAPNLDATAETVAIAHYRLKEGCRDKLNVMYFVADNQEDMEPEQILINDLYMLDLDTGYWYMDACIDSAALDFDTKENALMYFYDAFDKVRGEFSVAGKKVKLDYLPEQSLNFINQTLQANAAAKTPKIYQEESVNLWLSQDRLAGIEGIVNQPAGMGRIMISTIADVIAYLNQRFPTVSMECMSISDGTGRTLRSGKEIIEDGDRPVTRGDIATCVSYLLADNYKVETLVVFVKDDSAGEPCPIAINTIQTAGGYWFFDPVLLMTSQPVSTDVKVLPEMKCESAAVYMSSIQEEFDIVEAFQIASGSRVDYEVTSSGEILITGGASCVEALSWEPAA